MSLISVPCVSRRTGPKNKNSKIWASAASIIDVRIISLVRNSLPGVEPLTELGELLFSSIISDLSIYVEDRIL